MPVLHLTEQGARVGLRAGRLTVDLDGHRLHDLPARKVHQVVIHGNVRLTTPLVKFLLGQGVPVLYVSLSGKLYGLARQSELASATRLRAQFIAGESGLALTLARTFVAAKVRANLSLLKGMTRRLPEITPDYHALRGIQPKIQQRDRVDVLRGLEGLAARHYYRGVSKALYTYGFQGRNRRPPKDPVNAALSYGYAILFGRVYLAVLAAGLHPEVGMLHAETRRNPALVLDLMEEFRIPVVDVVVFRAFVRGQLHPAKHFEDRNGGIYLNNPGRKVLIAALEARFTEPTTHPVGFSGTYAEMIERQAQRLAVAIEGRITYSGFYPVKL